MIGAEIYAYRINFSCNENKYKNPYLKSIKLKLVDLFRPYYRHFSKFDDDLYIGICQYFMRKGLPHDSFWGGSKLRITSGLKEADKYLSDALFSCDYFLAESLYINNDHFKLMEWRKQFDIFQEMKIDGLKFYRNRTAIPLDNFESFDDIKRLIFNGRGRYGEQHDMLEFPYNECHKTAKYIIGRDVLVYPNYFYYHISYGMQDDFENFKQGKGHSSWDIYIRSEDNENYIDFCLRIFNRYDAIVKFDTEVIEQTSQYSSYYKIIN